MNAVRFITTYCRKSGDKPINIQRIEQTQFEEKHENQIAELWLQAYLEQNKEKETKI